MCRDGDFRTHVRHCVFLILDSVLGLRSDAPSTIGTCKVFYIIYFLPTFLSFAKAYLLTYRNLGLL